jgi:NCS1 family nucleobase:cation symporter-1
MYEYRHGFNLAALIALTAGIAVALVGRFAPSLEWLFKMAWFVGFFLSGAIYYLMMNGHRTALAEVEGLRK